MSLSVSSLSFQKHVESVSSAWPIYYPFYVSREDGILAFDRASKQWKSILSLSYLPGESSWSSVISRGPLICVIAEGSDSQSDTHSDKSTSFLVTNALTKCWRKLPCFGFCPPEAPDGDKVYEEPDLVTILPLSSDGYRILCVYGAQSEGLDRVRTLLYDSKLGRWTMKESQGLDGGKWLQSSAYLDEKLYCFYEDYTFVIADQWFGVSMYDLRQNSWTEQLGYTCDTNDGRDAEGGAEDSTMYGYGRGATLRCGDRIMVAFCSPRGPYNGEVSEEGWPVLHTETKSIVIFELIHDSPHFVARGPPEDIWGVGLIACESCDQIEFGSDADFMYFGQSIPCSPVLTFNVHSHEWSCLPPGFYSSVKNKLWGGIAFEAGLHLFIAV